VILAARNSVTTFDLILLGLLLLGILVVLYWVFRIIGFVVGAPFRALSRGRRKRTPSGLGADYEQLVGSRRGRRRLRRP